MSSKIMFKFVFFSFLLCASNFVITSDRIRVGTLSEGYQYLEEYYLNTESPIDPPIIKFSDNGSIIKNNNIKNNNEDNDGFYIINDTLNDTLNEYISKFIARKYYYDPQAIRDIKYSICKIQDCFSFDNFQIQYQDCFKQYEYFRDKEFNLKNFKEYIGELSNIDWKFGSKLRTIISCFLQDSNKIYGIFLLNSIPASNHPGLKEFEENYGILIGSQNQSANYITYRRFVASIVYQTSIHNIANYCLSFDNNNALLPREKELSDVDVIWNIFDQLKQKTAPISLAHLNDVFEQYLTDCSLNINFEINIPQRRIKGNNKNQLSNYEEQCFDRLKSYGIISKINNEMPPIISFIKNINVENLFDFLSDLNINIKNATANGTLTKATCEIMNGKIRRINSRQYYPDIKAIKKFLKKAEHYNCHPYGYIMPEKSVLKYYEFFEKMEYNFKNFISGYIKKTLQHNEDFQKSLCFFLKETNSLGEFLQSGVEEAEYLLQAIPQTYQKQKMIEFLENYQDVFSENSIIFKKLIRLGKNNIEAMSVFRRKIVELLYQDNVRKLSEFCYFESDCDFNTNTYKDMDLLYVVLEQLKERTKEIDLNQLHAIYEKLIKDNMPIDFKIDMQEGKVICLHPIENNEKMRKIQDLQLCGILDKNEYLNTIKNNFNEIKDFNLELLIRIIIATNQPEFDTFEAKNKEIFQKISIKHYGSCVDLTTFRRKLISDYFSQSNKLYEWYLKNKIEWEPNDDIDIIYAMILDICNQKDTSKDSLKINFNYFYETIYEQYLKKSNVNNFNINIPLNRFENFPSDETEKEKRIQDLRQFITIDEDSFCVIT